MRYFHLQTNNNEVLLCCLLHIKTAENSRKNLLRMFTLVHIAYVVYSCTTHCVIHQEHLPSAFPAIIFPIQTTHKMFCINCLFIFNNFNAIPGIFEPVPTSSPLVFQSIFPFTDKSYSLVCSGNIESQCREQSLYNVPTICLVLLAKPSYMYYH